MAAQPPVGQGQPAGASVGAGSPLPPRTIGTPDSPHSHHPAG